MTEITFLGRPRKSGELVLMTIDSNARSLLKLGETYKVTMELVEQPDAEKKEEEE